MRGKERGEEKAKRREGQAKGNAGQEEDVTEANELVGRLDVGRKSRRSGGERSGMSTTPKQRLSDHRQHQSHDLPRESQKHPRPLIVETSGKHPRPRKPKQKATSKRRKALFQPQNRTSRRHVGGTNARPRASTTPSLCNTAAFQAQKTSSEHKKATGTWKDGN